MCTCFFLKFYSGVLVFYLLFYKEKRVEMGGLGDGKDLRGDKEWKTVIRICRVEKNTFNLKMLTQNMSLEFYFLNEWKRSMHTCLSAYIACCSMFPSITGFVFFHSRNVDHITAKEPNKKVKFIKTILWKNNMIKEKYGLK